MKTFRLITKSRQTTDYSCGACCLQTVLSYWGKDVDETELMKLLGTTPEEGTYPEDLAAGARALGFEATVKDNLTLDEVEKFTANGDPMIALAQVWRSQKDVGKSVVEDFDDGHYIVVLGVDKDYVYFQDPFARMCKAFAPRKMFEDHWHQVMGGDLKKNPKLMHLGIFVRGKEPAKQKVAKEMDFSALDFRRFGSLNLMVTEFRGTVLPYDIMNELKDMYSSGYVRPDAFIYLRKDKDGNLVGMEGSRLQGDDLAEINALLAVITARSIGSPEQALSKAESAIQAAVAGDFGLSAGDIQKIAGKLSPNHTALIVLFENVWERKFKEIAKKYNGAVINQRLITADALAKAAGELTAAAHDG